MSRIENPREAIKDGSTGIFCLSITCQYGLLTGAFLFMTEQNEIITPVFKNRPLNFKSKQSITVRIEKIGIMSYRKW